MALFHSKQRRPELVRSVSYPNRVHGTRLRFAKSFPARKSRNFGAHFGALFIVGIAGFIFMTSGSNAVPRTLGVSAKQAIQQSDPVPEPPRTLDHSAMEAQVNAIISKYPRMDIGVSWVDIKTGESADYGEQAPFVAASTAKLLTAISYLHDVEAGKATLTQQVGGRTAEKALEAMIVDSDNTAWHDFNNSVMSHEELAAYAETIAFTGYDPSANTVTPGSLAKLLGNLYQRRLLNDEHTGLLLSYMERAKEVQYFSKAAPAGVKVYHKPGYLVDRVHDAAIIDNNDRPYVLVLFTKSRTGSYNSTHGIDIFNTVAKASFDSFIVQ